MITSKKLAMQSMKNPQNTQFLLQAKIIPTLHAVLVAAVFTVILLLVSSAVSAENKQPIRIFVSILPQKYFVKQIGGDMVEVNVMVGPGQSPETYEPSPKQMEKLSHAEIYFRMGMPFENIWMKRLKSLNSALVIIDARDVISLRNMDQDDILSPSPDVIQNQDKNRGLKDPHIWTNPMNVAIFMRNFTDNLEKMYPDYKALFENNYQRFAAQLNDLDSKIKSIFMAVNSKYLLVFHPSWGYFAERYGLKQIPIEVEGKSPNARSLTKVIDFAKKSSLKVVFTQVQFSQREAQAIATTIGGKVVAVDPLAEDYMNNLIEVAQQFARSLQ